MNLLFVSYFGPERPRVSVTENTANRTKIIKLDIQFYELVLQVIYLCETLSEKAINCSLIKKKIAAESDNNRNGCQNEMYL